MELWIDTVLANDYVKDFTAFGDEFLMVIFKLLVDVGVILAMFDHDLVWTRRGVKHVFV